MARSELEETYLTVADVAGMLKLNQQTVRNWIDQGSLPAVRVGRRVRIKQSDLEKILDEGYSGGSSTASVGGPSADDFWGGEAIGIADPAQVANGADSARGAPGRPSENTSTPNG